MFTLLSPKARFLTLALAALLASSALAQEPKSPATAPATAPAYTGKPYSGKPFEIPGTIPAVQYDTAPDNKGEGITYHYNGAGKTGPGRTTPDAIGLAKFGNGHVSTKGDPEKPDQIYVGWTQTGEWLKYSLHVKEAGTYIIGGKFAAGLKGAKVSFSFSPDITTGPVEIPTTAGFQPGVEVYHVWETLDKVAEVKLPAGDCVMTVKIEAVAGMNLESFSLTKKPE